MKEVAERELLHIPFVIRVSSYEVFCLPLFNVLRDLSVLLVYLVLKNSSSELIFLSVGVDLIVLL